jgi:uncharacterized FAD-dependent dehydrogenase
MAGIEFQRKIESKAFELGGKNYEAPGQLVGDFLAQKRRPTLAVCCHPINPVCI